MCYRDIVFLRHLPVVITASYLVTCDEEYRPARPQMFIEEPS